MSSKANFELIKVSKTVAGTSVVSARELHQFLECETQFSIWIKRMLEYGFVENQDYALVNQKRLTAQGNATTYIDYAITVDTVKQIAMIQRSDKGKEARQYFIEVEKRFLEGQKQLSPLELLAQQVQVAIEHERRISTVETRVDELEAKGSTIPTGFLTISGYATRTKQKISTVEAAKLGRLASRKCLELGYNTGSVHDEKFGSVNSYPIEVLQIIFSDLVVPMAKRFS